MRAVFMRSAALTPYHTACSLDILLDYSEALMKNSDSQTKCRMHGVIGVGLFVQVLALVTFG